MPDHARQHARDGTFRPQANHLIFRVLFDPLPSRQIHNTG